MRFSVLSMVSFALAVTPMIIRTIKPLIDLIVNTNTIGFKLTLTFLIFPLLSIYSIILARLSATNMIKYKLQGKSIAMSAIVIATMTFFISIYKMATLNL
jgi:hypothetical protein